MEWFNALIFIGISFGVAIVIQVIIELIFLRLAKKTKTTLDDEMIAKTRYPLFFVLVFIGVRITLKNYNLFESQLPGQIVTSLIYFIVILGIVRVVEISLKGLGLKIAGKTKSKVDDQMISLLEKSASIIIWVVGILFILGSWGIEIGPLLASLGIAGLAVAFALQNTLANIFGGVSLILDKNISVGDTVDVQGDGLKKGTVIDIGLRSTKIRNYDNEIIIIPNGELANSSLVNVAQPDPSTRVVIPFGVAYGSDIEIVKKIVLGEVKKIEVLHPDKKPSVKFLEMADSSLNFKLFFHIVDYTKKYDCIDKMNTAIYNAFNKNNIEIPFPQIDINMKK